MSYQGYANYETWAVALWIANEEGSYRYWKDSAEEILDKGAEDPENPTDDEMDDAKRRLADRLKDQFEGEMPEVEGMWSDLLTAALGEVDWYEVAEEQFAD